MVDNMFKAFDYACGKYYGVVYDYDRGHGGYGRVHGLLLNYASGNVVLLSDKGMYHLKYKDVIFMRPIEPPMDELSEEFKEVLESFKKDNN
jgi:hypothetical protein